MARKSWALENGELFLTQLPGEMSYSSSHSLASSEGMVDGHLKAIRETVCTSVCFSI